MIDTSRVNYEKLKQLEEVDGILVNYTMSGIPSLSFGSNVRDVDIESAKEKFDKYINQKGGE